jgi:archaellum biogenesis protein FlaJ (TadC family)
MAVFIKNDSAFLKNVGTFEAKRRGVLKKRLDAFDAGNVGTLSKSIEKSYKIFGL